MSVLFLNFLFQNCSSNYCVFSWQRSACCVGTVAWFDDYFNWRVSCIASFCPFLSVSVSFCQFLPVVASFCQFLPVSASVWLLRLSPPYFFQFFIIHFKLQLNQNINNICWTQKYFYDLFCLVNNCFAFFICLGQYMYGTPAPSLESQLPEALPASHCRHLREWTFFLMYGY